MDDDSHLSQQHTRRNSTVETPTTTSRPFAPVPSSPAVDSPKTIIQPTSTLAPLGGVAQTSFTSLRNFSQNMVDASQRGVASVAEPLERSKEWNTKNLGMRLAGDATSAAAAGGLVAPLISMIDRGIIENASNRRSLSQSIKSSLSSMVFRPHHFFLGRPFLLIFALYGGTYLSANTLDTFSSTIKSRPASSVTSGTSKFATTSAANLSLCLYKDSQFTKMFGAVSSPQTRVPPITYMLFAIRDSLTVFASFNVPPVLAPVLPIGEEVERYASRASIAQFIAPAAVQVISTPLHLLGLDLYNRPRGDGVSISSRSQRVVRDWGKSCLARICRIVPAFGVGGVVNTRVRRWWMTGLE